MVRAHGVTCQLKPPTPNQRRMSCGAGIPALAVTRGEAQHSSLLNARAVPRWLWSTHAVPKRTAPSRGLFPSARARGATCQLRPQCQANAAFLARHSCACARCRWDEVQHSSLLQARRAALFLVGS